MVLVNRFIARTGRTDDSSGIPLFYSAYSNLSGEYGFSLNEHYRVQMVPYQAWRE